MPNREATAKLVREHQADLGVAWDGDFDRCFLFDEKAEFIEGYYIVGLLAEVFLRKQPGAKIMYDPASDLEYPGSGRRGLAAQPCRLQKRTLPL